MYKISFSSILVVIGIICLIVLVVFAGLKDELNIGFQRKDILKTYINEYVN